MLLDEPRGLITVRQLHQQPRHHLIWEMPLCVYMTNQVQYQDFMNQHLAKQRVVLWRLNAHDKRHSLKHSSIHRYK